MKQRSDIPVWRRKDFLWGYLFVAPLTIGLLVFFIIPFAQTFWFSFNDVNKFNMSRFIGIQNYQELLADGEFWGATLNTLLYVVGVVPVGMLLSLIVAALLNTKIRGKGAYRTIYFLPAITMPAAIALAWKWIYNGQFGLLNQILAFFGLPGHNWLTDEKTALWMIIIVGIWSTLGYNMIILLAGMQGISRSYYEAASIDGASGLKQFFSITVPLLTPTLFFVLTTSVINAFRVFDLIFMMVSKSSIAYDSTQTLVMLFYRYAFDYGSKGYASAIAVLLFLMVLAVTAVQMKFQDRWVHYE